MSAATHAAHAPRLRLREDAYFSLVHRDESSFGSAMSGLIDRLVRLGCRSAIEAMRELEPRQLPQFAPELLAPCFGPDALGQLYTRPGQLREDCLYPSLDAVSPVRLAVELPDQLGAHGCAIDARLRPELARWLSDWREPSSAPRSGPARALWQSLERHGALTSAAYSNAARPLPELSFVGHACVALRRGDATLVFDPCLLPASGELPGGYAPLSPRTLAPTAVFITHSHPDHYDFSSLVQLGCETPIYVPEVPRESLLSIDMATRLRALGFCRVRTLVPGEVVECGPWRVHAERLCGEQPSDAEVFHPESPNLGLVYLAVATDGGPRVALLADAGPDHRGDCLQLAARMRAEHGAVDAIAGGFRAWHLNPLQFLDSSVPRYLLFVPPEQWGRRYSIMNGAKELVQVAEAWGARAILPYANGGAPWFWERGLGPRLDGSLSELELGAHDFDPGLGPLRRALAAARGRGVELELLCMHPGEGVAFDPARRRFSEPTMLAGGPWPFGSGATREAA